MKPWNMSEDDYLDAQDALKEEIEADLLEELRRLNPYADDDSGAGEAAAAENWLTGYLSGGARPSEEIALYEGWAAGFSRDAVLKAKKAIDVKVSKTGLTGWTWSLPEELHRLNPDADDDSLFDV